MESKTTREQRGHTAVHPRKHDHASSTTGRGEHHRLPMVPAVYSVLLLPEHYVLVLRFGPQVLPWIICIGPIRLLLQSFLT